MPDSKFLQYWNILMILLLIYVAIWVPYNICLSNSDVEVSNMDTFQFIMYIIDKVADFLFIMDLIINFISAYDNLETQLPEIKLKKIA